MCIYKQVPKRPDFLDNNKTFILVSVEVARKIEECCVRKLRQLPSVWADSIALHMKSDSIAEYD